MVSTSFIVNKKGYQCFDVIFANVISIMSFIIYGNETVMSEVHKFALEMREN